MNKIKRIGIILISALLSGILVLGASTAMAEQPPSSVEESICNPIGPPLNLNIHGEYPFALLNEKVLPDGNYLFRDEYSESTMQYVTKKKSMVTDQTILIPDTGSFNDASYNPSPKLMLSCVEEDFYIVGRIQATSHKEQSISQVGSQLLFTNPVIKAYTGVFPAHTHFLTYNEYSDDPIAPSDLSSTRHLYNAAPEGFVKFESTTSEEEKPLGIKPLFKWLGWLCKTIFVDINEDGDIDAYGLTFVTTD